MTINILYVVLLCALYVSAASCTCGNIAHYHNSILQFSVDDWLWDGRMFTVCMAISPMLC